MTTKPTMTKEQVSDFIGAIGRRTFHEDVSDLCHIIADEIVPRLPDDEPAPKATCGTCGGVKFVCDRTPEFGTGCDWPQHHGQNRRPCPDCSPKKQPIDVGADGAATLRSKAEAPSPTGPQRDISSPAPASSLLDRCARRLYEARVFGGQWDFLATHQRERYHVEAKAVLREALGERLENLACGICLNCNRRMGQDQCGGAIHATNHAALAELSEAMGVDRG